MYSLVNIATVVRDLARHRYAEAVAVDLLHVFALDEAALDSIERLRYDEQSAAAVRAQVLGMDRSRPRALQLLAAARSAASTGGLDAYVDVLDDLERAPLGDLTELVDFVRRDALNNCWRGGGGLVVTSHPRALDVVADGVAATYSGDARLGQSWRSWVDTHRLRPAASAWADVADVVAGVPADAEWPVPDAEWAPRMHDACWAIALTTRERAAAIAQLHALRALLAVHAPRPPAARAVATVTAAVHAHVAADLLDSATHEAMTQPLFRLLP